MSWPRFTMKKRADLRLVCLNMTDRWFGLLMPVQVLLPLSKCLLRALDQMVRWNKARRFKKWCHKQARVDDDGFRPPPQTEILPLWPWPWCRRTCLECLSQSDMWVEMWFPPHLQSHNYRSFFFFFYIKCSEHIRPWKHAGCWVSPKCRKTLPSFLAMFSWSLPRRSLYCCCLIFVTMYSASCREGACKEVTQWLTFVFRSVTCSDSKDELQKCKRENLCVILWGGGGGGEIKKTETVTVFFDTWMWRCVVCFVFCLFYY